MGRFVYSYLFIDRCDRGIPTFFFLFCLCTSWKIHGDRKKEREDEPRIYTNV